MATTTPVTATSGVAASTPAQRKRLWPRMAAARTLFFMFLPPFLLLVVFEYGSMYGLVIAFKDYNIGRGIWGSDWVGLRHFRAFFDSPAALNVLKNTLIISLLKLLFGLPAPILLALLINEAAAGFFKRFVQSVSYLPHFISWVILASMVYTLLSPTSGAVNGALGAMGLQPIYFMTSDTWFRVVLVASEIWKGVGWGTILYLAALAGISTELYDAAIIDGASRLQRIRHINLPAIVPVVAILVILNMGYILNAGFDQVFNLYNAQVYDVGDIIDTYVYRTGLLSLQYSFAAAIGFFKAAVGLVLILVANTIARRASEGRYGLW